jgi:hypothetical protein
VKGRWKVRRRSSAIIAVLALVAIEVLLPTTGRAEDREATRQAAGNVAPRSDRSDEPVPLRVFTDEQGRSCRVYERRVIIDGGATTALATVCRDASGRWVLSR